MRRLKLTGQGLSVGDNRTLYKGLVLLRKWTTPVHWIYGMFCGVVAVEFFPAGVTLMLVFAGMEMWNDWCDGTRGGCTDWWESFLTFCGAFGIALMLDLAGVIGITWK